MKKTGQTTSNQYEVSDSIAEVVQLTKQLAWKGRRNNLIVELYLQVGKQTEQDTEVRPYHIIRAIADKLDMSVENVRRVLQDAEIITKKTNRKRKQKND